MVPKACMAETAKPPTMPTRTAVKTILRKNDMLPTSMARESIGMTCVMRGVVNGFHMRKANKTDDEQTKHDRRQRLREAARFC
ncbi:hypothetical protein D3C80_1625210 [compost metagenome]